MDLVLRQFLVELGDKNRTQTIGKLSKVDAVLQSLLTLLSESLEVRACRLTPCHQRERSTCHLDGVQGDGHWSVAGDPRTWPVAVTTHAMAMSRADPHWRGALWQSTHVYRAESYPQHGILEGCLEGKIRLRIRCTSHIFGHNDDHVWKRVGVKNMNITTLPTFGRMTTAKSPRIKTPLRKNATYRFTPGLVGSWDTPSIHHRE